VNPSRSAFGRAAPSFDDTRNAIRELIAQDTADPGIDPRAYPRLYDHGAAVERSTVLFHGMTNCPQQFDQFARLLHERGDNVYVPRLPYHGYRNRMTRALGDITTVDIEHAANEAARLGQGLGTQVNALGISLGATMALWLAQTGGVVNAVALAPFLMIPFIPRLPGLLFMSVLQTLPNHFLWWDPRRKEQILPEYAYPGFWTHCLAQCTLAGSMISAAAAEEAPAAPHCTTVINAHDPAVNNGPARDLVARWRRHGAPYDLAVWDDLGRVHDVIDPSTYAPAGSLVYPRLLALLDS
jgi:alpha-beta hydrolase superfamily lysophospholipase